MTPLEASVVNEALQWIDAQTLIDPVALTPANIVAAADTIYIPTVQMLLRQLDPDFARMRIQLSPTGNAPPDPYGFEYFYPSDCLRTRQVAPRSSAYDSNDPQPVRWAVANDIVLSAQTKVILTNQADANLVYTSSQPTELQWDSIFRESVVVRLSVPLSMALAGRPDFARSLLQEAAQMAGMEGPRDDGA
jgi:hypothetical protein